MGVLGQNKLRYGLGFLLMDKRYETKKEKFAKSTENLPKFLLVVVGWSGK